MVQSLGSWSQQGIINPRDCLFLLDWSSDGDPQILVFSENVIVDPNQTVIIVL